MTAIILAIYLIACALVGFIGRGRLIRFWGFFAVAFFFTPLAGLLIAVLTTPRRVPG
jgi:hypothetical protein